MSLPESVRVKISSEGAGSIGISPVVAQELPLEDLIGRMLGITGKDASRIGDLLCHGTLVSGGSRFRWQAIVAEGEEIERFLVRFPDSEPARTFRADACYQAILRGGPKALTLDREAGKKKRLFRRRSFWDELMIAVSTPAYVEYSYRERADVYRAQLSLDDQRRVREAASLLAYSSFERQVSAGGVNQVDLLVRR